MAKFLSKRSDRKENFFPQPSELEARIDYIKRISSDSLLLQKFGSKKIEALASAEWEKAKGRSLVSISTQGGQFLMFGSLVQNW